MLLSRGSALAFLALVSGAIFAADPPAEPAELSALRRDFDKRRAEAVRPVFSWYESELYRLERSFTTRGNLDAALAVRKERELSHGSQAQVSPVAFKAQLDDTRWRWNGASPVDITFKRDGFVDCPEWNRQGYVIRWQPTGANVVTYTVVKGPANVGQDAVLTFAPDLKSFQGVNADGNPINLSPRLK
jgi:hypothetical protein